MNNRGMDSLLHSKVKLGVDASVAAGPKGRSASADTDAYMRAEMLSYSRARGVFAGIRWKVPRCVPTKCEPSLVRKRFLRCRNRDESKFEAPASGAKLVHRLQKASLT